jgi:hypothetical protein
MVALFLLAIGWAVAFGWVYVQNQANDGTIGFDFRGTLYEPAQRIADGESPYLAPVREEVEVGNPPLYPPLVMLAVVPLTALPWQLAFAVWAAVLVGGVLLALRVLGVRDPRCYVAALLPAALLLGVTWGNVAVLLIPLAAVAWAYRDRSPILSGAAVGLAVAAKLYLWPLGVWLLATRRYPAFGSSMVTAIVGILGAWAVIGFDGLLDYPDLLRVAEEVYAGHSFSLATAAAALDLGTTAGPALCVGAAALVSAVAFVVGRRGLDAAAFSLVVLAAILGAAIAWPYTFTLVVVPIAIAFPRYSAVWLTPMLLLAAELMPRPQVESLPPGRPDGVPPVVWAFNNAASGFWPALGYAGIAAAITGLAVFGVSNNRGRERAGV